MMIAIFSILILTVFGKLCTDNAFDSSYSIFKNLMKVLSIKIITSLMNIIRMITLIFLLTIFTRCVLYFSTIKHTILLDQNGIGLSTFNLVIIGSICIIIILRSTEYIGTNIIRVIYTFDDSDNKPFLSDNIAWVVLRGIIAPLVTFFELCMICYLIFYQDGKNRSDRTKIAWKSTKFIKKDGFYY